MNFSTFYYFAVLIAIAAKLFGYLAISWLWLIGFALMPLLVAVAAVTVVILMSVFFKPKTANFRGFNR